MKIAITNPEFVNPRGAQRQALMLAREWQAMGHEVHLFAGRKATPYAFDALLEGLPSVHETGDWTHTIRRGGTLPGSNHFRARYTDRVLRDLAGHIEREGFDAVNAHNHPAQWIARHLQRARITWTCNEPPVWHYYPTARNRWDHFLLARHDRRNAPHLDAITVLDERMAAMTRAAYPTAPVHVTGSGCELPGPLPARGAPPPEGSGPPLDGGAFHAVSVLGFLNAQKRPLDAVEALGAAGVPRPHLHLVGAEEAGVAQRLEERARALGVTLHRHRSVSESYLLYLYANADVALFLPENQPWGIFPLEATLAGVPAVLSNEVGALEALGSGGRAYPWVAPVGDAAGAAAHIRAIHADPAAAKREVAAFRALLQERYSWKACAERVLAVLRAA